MANYNSTLQSNNTDLQAILDTINELPEAKGETVVLQNKTISPTTNQQIISADSGYDGLSTITISGDDDLIADNIKSGINIFGVVGTYDGRDASEDLSAENKIVARTITNYTNSNITNIGTYAFAHCYNLSLVNFPNCTIIGSSAFADCSNLTTINFPNCTTIEYNAFSDCGNLTILDFPNCITIGDAAFSNCRNLTVLNFPKCTTIGWQPFKYCFNITEINFPNCTIIGSSAFSALRISTASFPNCITIEDHAFDGVSELIEANFPKCTTIGIEAFAHCGLKTASFPECTTIGSRAFDGCGKLSSLSFPKCTTIENEAFCSALQSLYLMGSSICNLLYVGAIDRSYTNIYVPKSLLTSYKTATNWTYLSSRIFGI
jgi:hypothetical protein